MTQHHAISPGKGAVITGAASGIGLAAAQRFASLGMSVLISDIDEAALATAKSSLAAIARPDARIIAMKVDVSKREAVEEMKNAAFDAFGDDLSILMNNAGREGGGQLFGDPARWRATLETNLFGVINGIQAFAPEMIKRGGPGAIISTGSKQGITTPPGDTAYNISKAGVKIATEALAHELRSVANCRISAHLLVPGFTFTGLTRARTSEKPAGAWMPEQVIDFLLDAMGRGEFYVLCPDNDVTRAMDEKRIRWAAQDIIENRPALSRWHPDYKDAFAAYMAASAP